MCTQCQSMMERYRQYAGHTQAMGGKYNTHIVIIILLYTSKIFKQRPGGMI